MDTYSRDPLCLQDEHVDAGDGFPPTRGKRGSCRSNLNALGIDLAVLSEALGRVRFKTVFEPIDS